MRIFILVLLCEQLEAKAPIPTGLAYSLPFSTGSPINGSNRSFIANCQCFASHINSDVTLRRHAHQPIEYLQFRLICASVCLSARSPLPIASGWQIASMPYPPLRPKRDSVLQKNPVRRKTRRSGFFACMNFFRTMRRTVPHCLQRLRQTARIHVSAPHPAATLSRRTASLRRSGGSPAAVTPFRGCAPRSCGASPSHFRASRACSQ